MSKREMKSVFDIAREGPGGFGGYLKERASRIVNDGSKYGSQNDSDRIHNNIIGYTTPGELKELETKGVIVYRGGSWRVPCEQTIVNGKVARVVSSRYLGYCQKRFGSRELAVADAEAKASLVDQAVGILDGRVIDERNITGG